MAIVGLVEEEAIFREIARPPTRPCPGCPIARLMFDTPRDRDAEFELVVRALIEGLHARLSRGCVLRGLGSLSWAARPERRTHIL